MVGSIINNKLLNIKNFTDYKLRLTLSKVIIFHVLFPLTMTSKRVYIFKVLILTKELKTPMNAGLDTLY